MCTYPEGLTWWAVILLIIFAATMVLLFLFLCYNYCYRKIIEYNLDTEENLEREKGLIEVGRNGEELEGGDDEQRNSDGVFPLSAHNSLEEVRGEN